MLVPAPFKRLLNAPSRSIKCDDAIRVAALTIKQFACIGFGDLPDVRS